MLLQKDGKGLQQTSSLQKEELVLDGRSLRVVSVPKGRAIGGLKNLKVLRKPWLATSGAGRRGDNFSEDMLNFLLVTVALLVLALLWATWLADFCWIERWVEKGFFQRTAMFVLPFSGMFGRPLLMLSDFKERFNWDLGSI